MAAALLTDVAGTVGWRLSDGSWFTHLLPHFSYLLAGLIPQARVKIYPDAAHGFLFQHHADFARDVDAFLRE